MDIWVLSAFWIIINNAATNSHEQGFIWTCVFSSLRYFPSTFVVLFFTFYIFNPSELDFGVRWPYQN